MKVKDFSYLNVIGEMDHFLETRYDYSGGPNIVFIGWNHAPNASVDALTWYIVKLNYTGANLTYQQLPIFGQTFTGSWTLRATYFP